MNFSNFFHSFRQTYFKFFFGCRLILSFCLTVQTFFDFFGHGSPGGIFLGRICFLSFLLTVQTFFEFCLARVPVATRMHCNAHTP